MRIDHGASRAVESAAPAAFFRGRTFGKRRGSATAAANYFPPRPLFPFLKAALHREAK